jgi:hypothetical protein
MSGHQKRQNGREGVAKARDCASKDWTAKSLRPSHTASIKPLASCVTSRSEMVGLSGSIGNWHGVRAACGKVRIGADCGVCAAQPVISSP